jgi:hypothetical protein
MPLPVVDLFHRILVNGDLFLVQHLVQQLILAVAEPADRPALRRVTRVAFGKVDATCLQEAAHAVIARLAIHIRAVIGIDIEWFVVSTVTATLYVGIEHTLPRLGVQHCGLGDHTVHIENCGIVWVSTHALNPHYPIVLRL